MIAAVPGLTRLAAALTAMGVLASVSTADSSVVMRLGSSHSNLDPVADGVLDVAGPDADGWFPIEVAEHEITALVSWTSGSGAMVGKPNPGSLKISKRINALSPYLLGIIASGRSMDEAQIVIRDANAARGPFYWIALQGLYVTRISQSLGDGGAGTEDLELVYRSIGWSYHRRDTAGATEFSSALHWNVPELKLEEGALAVFEDQVPHAGTDAFIRLPGSPLTIPIASLVSNDSRDAWFAGLVSDKSTLGGSVAIAGSDLVYTPPSPDPGTEDGFSYTLQDLAGRSVRGEVVIGVRIPDPPPILRVTVLGDGITLHLSGPGSLRFQLQSADDIAGPWGNVGTPVAPDSEGNAEFQNTTENGSRYYRFVLAP